VKNNNFSINNNIYSNFYKSKFINRLSRKFNKVYLEIQKDLSKSGKTLNVLSSEYNFNFKIKDLDKFKKFKIIAIIGMGGSSLGTRAIYNFFESKIKKKIYFFDNLEEKKIKRFKKKISSKILFIVISKSGNTVETLSNTFFLDIIKRNAKNVILISEKKNNNFLYSLSKKLNLSYFEHRDYIGGRYSVLSEAGIIPAYLMGIKIFKLRSKLLECLKNKNKSFLKKNTVIIAQLMSSGKFNNFILLNYFPELEKFLYWCQQLIAESLGKKNKGFLPTVSNAPRDHHSLLQLYLDGPKDKFFNIFSFEKKTKDKIKVHIRANKKNFLNNKSLNTIKKAQKNALVKSLKKKQIPFREFKIKKNDEETLGNLFSYFLIETVIVGKLLNINPFDQPAVEQVKVYTKKLLS
tara:strand:- start:2462 stop:3679 length:1218 start_codon:yes stop_codon:yes gene_type:complete